MDASATRLDTDSTTSVAAVHAFAADSRTACFVRGTRKELATVLGITTDKGPIATLFDVLGAPIYLWTRKKLAGVARVALHKRTILTLLDVLGACA